MTDSLAAVVLAAGGGTRLRPLTHHRPKALCPVGNRPLVEWALDRAAALVGSGSDHLAVNAHHLAHQIVDQVAGRAEVSVEPELLGTAGGVARLRPWIAGRAVLVLNADTWTDIELTDAIESWPGEHVRIVVRGELPGAIVLAALLPPSAVEDLPEGFGALERVSWWPRQALGELEVVSLEGVAIACDRPREYLAANLVWSAGEAVVGDGARVEGRVERSVVWDGASVEAGEILVDAIRTDDGLTVLVR
jgi:hypothetical protein